MLLHSGFESDPVRIDQASALVNLSIAGPMLPAAQSSLRRACMQADSRILLMASHVLPI